MTAENRATEIRRYHVDMNRVRLGRKLAEQLTTIASELRAGAATRAEIDLAVAREHRRAAEELRLARLAAPEICQWP